MTDEVKEPVQVETQKASTGKLTFGVAGLNNPTPTWVTWIFRTEFVLNKAVMLWIAASDLVKNYNVKEIMLILSIVDFVTWGLGRFVGVKKADFEQ